MIPYDPITGDILSHLISNRPRTCFIMTKLGSSISPSVQETRSMVEKCLKEQRFEIIDASSVTTGRDFLVKIWNLILAVPLGIAIVCEGMGVSTLENIYFELGVMQSLGKETVLIKVGSVECATDLIRAEHLEAPDLGNKITGFLTTCLEQADHYETLASELKDKNPLLALDYIKRAFLITGDAQYKKQLLQIVFDSSHFDKFIQDEVNGLLIME